MPKKKSKKPCPVAQVPLKDLHDSPDPHNHMPEAMFGRLAEAMRRFGCLQPLLVRSRPKGGYWIVDGHHRQRAATKAGLTAVPCVVADSADDVAAVQAIGLNRMRGEPDLLVVGTILTGLLAEGWTPEDLEVTGFALDEIEACVSSQPSAEDFSGVTMPDVDAAPKLKKYVLRLEFASKGDLDLVVFLALQHGPAIEAGLVAWATRYLKKGGK